PLRQDDPVLLSKVFILFNQSIESEIDCFLINVNLGQTWLKVQRERRPITDGLSKGIAREVSTLILVSAEPHECVAIATVDRGAGQAEEESVRECLTHQSTVITFLRTVSLIHHGDDVVAVIEHLAL